MNNVKFTAYQQQIIDDMEKMGKIEIDVACKHMKTSDVILSLNTIKQPNFFQRVWNSIKRFFGFKVEEPMPTTLKVLKNRYSKPKSGITNFQIGFNNKITNKIN